MADKSSGDQSAEENKGMGLKEISALFMSFGISRSEFLSYSLPYIYAVAAQLMQYKTAQINPLVGMLGAPSAQAPANETYGQDGKLTVDDVKSFFND